MTSDAALDLFVSICDQLGIVPAKDADSIDREGSLLNMIGIID